MTYLVLRSLFFSKCLSQTMNTQIFPITLSSLYFNRRLLPITDFVSFFSDNLCIRKNFKVST